MCGCVLGVSVSVGCVLGVRVRVLVCVARECMLVYVGHECMFLACVGHVRVSECWG